jgi:phosphinothricin acetyltransferase
MIRLATDADVEAIWEIYRPAVEESSVSFETSMPSPKDMQQRIQSCLLTYPWIVDDGKYGIRGYAYAGEYHQRAAYRWAAQVSVYVGKESLRQGVARHLYRALFAMLQQQGIRKLMAAITVPNEASQQFHESAGFAAVGVVSDVGYKRGDWQSMGWWQRSLGDGAQGEPSEFAPFSQLAAGFTGDLSDLSAEA